MQRVRYLHHRLPKEVIALSDKVNIQGYTPAVAPSQELSQGVLSAPKSVLMLP